METDAGPRQEPPTIRLKDYRPPDFLVESVDLAFDLGDPVTQVEATLKFRRNPDGEPGAPLRLDGNSVQLDSIALDGAPLDTNRYVLDDRRLTVADVPDAFTATIATSIRPAENTQLSGLYTSGGAFCTQCEAEGFRRIAFFPDRPDVMAAFRVTIRAERAACPILLSNGNLTAARDLDDGHHEAVWEDPFPKPSYLFALVAGDLALVEDRFTTMSGRDVRLCIYVEHGNEGRCGYAMDVLKRAMRWDEERFGLEYDLDRFNIVAVSDFNMGAMENKSLNIFNARYVLADPRIATDYDYADIETVVSHEYFHNWTGNRVTCRDWFQLSLKEGLTVFRDQEFSSEQRSRPVTRIGDVRWLRAGQFPEDAGPLAHPVRPASYIQINNFYTSTVYQKGAEVIRMMHALIGEDGFRKGMDLYFARHDGQAVTCDDFAAAMEDASGVDLSQFRLWYSQAGTPQLTARGAYDAEARAYDLTVTQRIPDTPGQTGKAAMHIPLEAGLLDRDGAELPLALEGEGDEADAPTTRVLHVRSPTQTFRFTGIDSEPTPSLNRGFSAPVRLDADWSDAQRALLFARDPDPFARWEAGQTYAAKVLLEWVAALRAGDEPAPATALIEAVGAILADPRLEPAFQAEAILLPREGYIGDQMDVVDVNAIHDARERLRLAIATALRGPLEQAYRAMRSNEPYTPDPEQAGRRALKNCTLAYIGKLGDDAALALVTEQARTADNMTDSMGALGVLNDLERPEREELHDAFYAQWRDNPLVVEKWLALRALSNRTDTLAAVEGLLRHEAFSIRNPNKVRALIGSFVVGNQLRFHARDGSGYAFAADRVLELDRLNPQVAARLLPPLGRWRRHDAGRQEKMRAALRRVLEAPGLSADCYELATKSLGE